MSASPSELSHGDTARILWRALGFIRPLWKRLLLKMGLALLGILPTLILPWPGKVVVDQVIQGIAPEDTPAKYPFFFEPIAMALSGAPVETVAGAMFGLGLVMLLLFGAWSTAIGGRDLMVDEEPGRGQDAATRSEEDANNAYSYAGGLLGFIEFNVTLGLSQALNHIFRSRLFEALQRLPMTSLDNQRIGDAIYRVMYDTPTISDICYRGLITPIVRPVEIMLAIWLLTLSYSHVPVVIWVVVGIVPVTLLATFPFSGPLRQQAERARLTGSDTTTTMEEASTNILAVQSLGAQARERRRFDADSWRSFDEFRRWYLLTILMGVTAALGAVGLGTVVYYKLTDAVFAGLLTVGDLFAVLAIYVTVGFLSSQIGLMWILVQKNVAGLKRVFEILDLPADHQPSSPKPLPTVAKGYSFEKVGFSYPDGTQALTDITLTAERGQMVALVGPAGAGKTTLAYMFPRFVWPKSGRILVDGVDLSEVHRDDLRKQVSFVFQEPVLINATIADNIRIGKPDATAQEMRRAAEISGALEFIERLPQGFETPLGRNGARLSVGQKQRLSIARALVREAPVLILDEPTAALDPETEHQLVRTLSAVARDRLVIVIAHRLSTIRHADQILFLRDGTIVERGNHAELMKQVGGAYRRFVELQTEQAA